jgi:hypothetical protein
LASRGFRLVQPVGAGGGRPGQRTYAENGGVAGVSLGCRGRVAGAVLSENAARPTQSIPRNTRFTEHALQDKLSLGRPRGPETSEIKLSSLEELISRVLRRLPRSSCRGRPPRLGGRNIQDQTFGPRKVDFARFPGLPASSCPGLPCSFQRLSGDSASPGRPTGAGNLQDPTFNLWEIDVAPSPIASCQRLSGGAGSRQAPWNGHPSRKRPKPNFGAWRN